MKLSPGSLAIRICQGKAVVDEVKLPSGKRYSLLSLPYFFAAKLDDYAEQLIPASGKKWGRF